MSQEWIDLVQPGLAEDFFHVGEMPPFDGSEISAKSFSPALALWMAEFSRLIYRREEKEFKANPPLVARGELLKNARHGWRELQFFNGLEPGERAKRRLWRL